MTAWLMEVCPEQITPSTGTVLTGKYTEKVAHLNLLGRDDLFAFSDDPSGGAGREVNQFFNAGTGFGNGQILPEALPAA